MKNKANFSLLVCSSSEEKGMIKAMKKLRKAMKELRKVFILACAFISTFMLASTAAHADLIYEEPDTFVGGDVVFDPVELAEYTFMQVLPYVIIVIVLIITALLVALFVNKKKKDNNKKDNETE